MNLEKEINSLKPALAKAAEQEVHAKKNYETARERRAFISGQLNAIQALHARQLAEDSLAASEADAKEAAAENRKGI